MFSDASVAKLANPSLRLFKYSCALATASENSDSSLSFSSTTTFRFTNSLRSAFCFERRFVVTYSLIFLRLEWSSWSTSQRSLFLVRVKVDFSLAFKFVLPQVLYSLLDVPVSCLRSPTSSAKSPLADITAIKKFGLSTALVNQIFVYDSPTDAAPQFLQKLIPITAVNLPLLPKNVHDNKL